MIAEHGFGTEDVTDLLFVNFKQSDDGGHKWGVESPEVGEVLQAQGPSPENAGQGPGSHGRTASLPSTRLSNL